MKFCLLLVCLAILSPLSNASAVPTPPVIATRRTVMDYFDLLPSQYFEVTNRRDLLKKEALPVVDLKNDYIRTIGDGAQHSLEIMVFRFNGRETVAVSSTNGIDFFFDLWRYDNGKWRTVTADLSPVISKANLHFLLPRNGTTIKVFQSNGTHLASLYWEKGQFNAESFDPNNRR